MRLLTLKLPSFHPHAYTRLVRRLRIVLPVTAVLVLAVVVIWPHFDPAQTRKRHAEAAPPEMNHSHFSGVDKHNRPYTITADRAVQKANAGNDIDLIKPVGHMTLTNGAWVTLTADQGEYREDPGIITLEGNVTMTHQNGYSVTTGAARIDIEDGVASSDQPTKGHGPRGEVEGEGFQMAQEGDKIIFTGKSRLLMLPDQDDEPADQSLPVAQ